MRGYWVSTVCKPKWHICIFVVCNLLLRARNSFISAAVKSRVLLVYRTIDNLAPMMTSSLPLASAWKGLSPCKIICQMFKSCKWSLSVSWDHRKLVSHGQHHLAHEKQWNVMEHFRNERARHMICKRNHALDRGRLDFSAPITSSISWWCASHQLVSAGHFAKCVLPCWSLNFMNLIVCLCKKTYRMGKLLPLPFQLKPSFASAIFDRQVLKQCSGRIWMCSTPESVDTHSEPDRHFVSAKPRSVIPSKMTTTMAAAMRMTKKLLR